MLFPREHGAYAQLGLPLAAALAGARPSVASVCLALASSAAFVAHEPFLVLLGHRGTRARRQDGPRARRWLAAAVAIGAAVGLAALALSPAARPWVAVPFALALGAGGFALMRRERTLAGELVASAALTSAALPTAVASGASWRAGLALSAVFYATTLLSTVEVRAIARQKERSIARAGAWITGVALIVVLALAYPAFALASLPTVLAVVVIAASRPKPARLRRIGWALASASLLTAVAAALALRYA
jgi:hypothetical protein